MKNNNFDSINVAANNNSENNGGMIMMNATVETMDEFAQVVKEAVEASLGDGYEVSINEVLKNNDTRLTGLTIRTEESNIAPTIYLEGSFERYKAGDTSVPVIVSEILSVYENHKSTVSFDVSMVADFSACKERVCYKLVNAERNRELLADAPHHIVCEDLAVVYYILVSNDGEGTATITVRTPLFENWTVSEEELFKITLANTQRIFRGSVRSMSSVLVDLLSDRMDEETSNEFYDLCVSSEDLVPMYVCTNSGKIHGAGAMLYEGLLKDFSKRTGCDDFFILPSSVHEVLFVPASEGMIPEALRNMVHEVNSTQVAPEEFLSDNVYVDHRAEDRIVIA